MLLYEMAEMGVKEIIFVSTFIYGLWEIVC